jgi:hypothetical protein
MSLERTNPPGADAQVPATRADAPVGYELDGTGDSREWRQPVGVAFLPVALATFLVIAFAMAMWTFLAATG